MDFNYTPDEIAFRNEVRSWLKENIPEDLHRKVVNYGEFSKEDYLRWHRIMAKKGWVAPAWPVEWGGTGWDVTRRYIFEEEVDLAGAPLIIPFGVVMCGQVLLKFGTKEQKKRFLPRIYNGDDFWVQGYSEPGAGSDLASLKMRAERRGDKYIVNGQKTWTSVGHYGDWIFCLVRTDLEAKKQEGISFLLIDMKTPGITVRPLHIMDDQHEVNEVFFDDVEVPVENLVYEEGQGWTVAKYLLGHERLHAAHIGKSKRLLSEIKVSAAKQSDGRGGRLLDNPRFRDRLTRVEAELMALEITNLRFLDAIRGGRPLGAEVSMLKMRGTEITQALTEMAVQAAGPNATPRWKFSAGDAIEINYEELRLTARYAYHRAISIFGGSNEIQRNIIAKMRLEL